MWGKQRITKTEYFVRHFLENKLKSDLRSQPCVSPHQTLKSKNSSNYTMILIIYYNVFVNHFNIIL